jgi:hypothetical protein
VGTRIMFPQQKDEEMGQHTQAEDSNSGKN